MPSSSDRRAGQRAIRGRRSNSSWATLSNSLARRLSCEDVMRRRSRTGRSSRSAFLMATQPPLVLVLWARIVNRPRLEFSQTTSAFSVDTSSTRTGHHTLDSTLASERMATTLVVSSQSLSATRSLLDWRQRLLYGLRRLRTSLLRRGGDVVGLLVCATVLFCASSRFFAARCLLRHLLVKLTNGSHGQRRASLSTLRPHQRTHKVRAGTTKWDWIPASAGKTEVLGSGLRIRARGRLAAGRKGHPHPSPLPSKGEGTGFRPPPERRAPSCPGIGTGSLSVTGCASAGVLLLLCPARRRRHT